LGFVIASTYVCASSSRVLLPVFSVGSFDSFPPSLSRKEVVPFLGVLSAGLAEGKRHELKIELIRTVDIRFPSLAKCAKVVVRKPTTSESSAICKTMVNFRLIVDANVFVMPHGSNCFRHVIFTIHRVSLEDGLERWKLNPRRI